VFKVAKAKEAKKETVVAVKTNSERFVAEIERQFIAEMGEGVKFTDYEKTLAQHLYVSTVTALQKQETERQKRAKPGNGTPITWENLNCTKLALDAVHRINLGLDALVPNHISPIAYWNSKALKYDVDLRIGYAGKDYYKRKVAIKNPIDIEYHLVYETDHFVPIKRDSKHSQDNYVFEIKEPFNRGKVVGGFGYIIYDDPTENKLVLVEKKEFDKARAYAQTDKFWEKHPIDMMYKTLVHRVTKQIPVDPAKVNKSYLFVEDQETEEPVLRAIAEHANQETIDVDYVVDPSPEPPPQDDPDPEPPEPGTKGKPEQQGLDIDPAAGF